MMITDTPTMIKESRKWSAIIFGISFALLFGFWANISQFGIVGETITLNLRTDLYREILKKHMGWHDDAQNAAGVLTSVLANDMQLLRGVSTETVAMLFRVIFTLIGGCIIGIIFVW